MRPTEILDHLQQRAGRHLGESRLVVDYYRIRRRLAYPWPLAQMPEIQFKTRFENYPWHTWLSWSVEERINAMGWAADLGGDEALRQRSREEIASVARWPTHVSGAALDLCFGHLLRTLVMAKRNWPWLGESVQAEILLACRRAVEQKLAWMAENLPQYQSVAEILAAEDPDHLTRNIPLIGTTALALAAHEAQDPSAEALRNRVATFLLARMALQEKGASENVAYDGYVLDFVSDLLPILPVKQRQAILDDPGIRRTLAMSIQLAAPGNVLNVANLADVEPKEMPFHASAHAKFATMLPIPESIWYLQHCPLEWLRADTLAAMHHLPDDSAQAPAPDIAIGPYAITLRTGWNEDDTAVAIGAPRAGKGHLHCDGGSIMIARGGLWLLADPGYQQYLETREREFTLGPRADNAPVINGLAQNSRHTKILATSDNPHHALLDLTASFPAELKLTSVTRAIWLLPTGTVVLCDSLHGPAIEKIEYTFHGLPGGYWWAQDNTAIIHQQGAELWIASPNAPIRQEQITRLPGSRGHESLLAQLPPDTTHCWWIFNVGPKPVGFDATATSLTVDHLTLNAD